MARGKYSPTVTNAYTTDINWFARYSQGQLYDPEGYDSYGYNCDDIDRAGYNELDYIRDDDAIGNWAYDAVSHAWSFDGVKPVSKYALSHLEATVVEECGLFEVLCFESGALFFRFHTVNKDDAEVLKTRWISGESSLRNRALALKNTQ